jgi:soluble lytic murein transglycosylase-like protein
MATNKECIAKNLTGCKFVVKENPRASGKEPFYELSTFSEVRRNEPLIDRVARETGVDGRLIRAIMYVETTHGYYDFPLAWFDKEKSILPMNVNVAYWGNAFGSRKALNDPYTNIKAGASILARIQANLPYGSPISHVATLYNNINAVEVSNYGARVQKVYEEQPWVETDSRPRSVRQYTPSRPSP